MSEASKAVFLSYASQDAGAAERLCTALRAAGIEVWLDRSELRGGDAWDAAIRQQILACTLFIPLISRHTLARDEGYFRLEWKLAIDRSHLMAASRAFLLPVVLDDTPPGGDHVPERFRELQWTRLDDGLATPAFVERVARLLAGSAARGAAAPATAATAAPPGPSTRFGGRRAAALTLLVVGGLAAALVGGRMLAPRGASPGVAASVAPGAEAVRPNSIAVLPFRDLSAEHDQEYFSDGLAESLIDLLAKTPQLHVMARAASFAFKGKPDDTATIAAKLHVATILDGSVRRAGNRLRISTQLVRAATGEPLSSETFDRDLSDVFQVQDDVAAAVVAALKLRLAPVVATGARTRDPAAYTEFLLGRQAYNRFNAPGFREAAAHFRKAIEIDPAYAGAWADLAMAEFLDADARADEPGYGRAREAADRAVELAPGDAAGYSARGFLRTIRDWDWAAAEADYRTAIQLEPGAAAVYQRYPILLLALKRPAEAIAGLKTSLELDPSAPTWLELARAYTAARDYPAAQRAVRRTLDLSPNSDRALAYQSYLALLTGDARGARQVAERIDPAVVFHWAALALADHTLGEAAGSDAALARLTAEFAAQGAYQIAEVHAWRGETDAALAWLDRAYTSRDGGMTLLSHDPLLDSLRTDPRFVALLRRMHLPG